MTFSFEPVSLDASNGDDEGRLVFRDGRLLAVVSCLGKGHGDAVGRWFVEAVFSAAAFPFHETMLDLAEVEARLASALGAERT
jgi:hypothetical protein